jgi:hypothetical protein
MGLYCMSHCIDGWQYETVRVPTAQKTLVIRKVVFGLKLLKRKNDGHYSYEENSSLLKCLLETDL